MAPCLSDQVGVRISMITNAVPRPLPLHHHRRVTERHAVTSDFAGALGPRAPSMAFAKSTRARHPLFPAHRGSLDDAADFASRCGPASRSTPLRPRPLNRTRRLRHRGPWRLPGPDSHRLAVESFSLATPRTLLPTHGVRAAGRTWIGAQPGELRIGCLRSKNSGSPMLSLFISSICACNSGGGSLRSPSRASASEVKYMTIV